jgi:hypothetical protein
MVSILKASFKNVREEINIKISEKKKIAKKSFENFVYFEME